MASTATPQEPSSELVNILKQTTLRHEWNTAVEKWVRIIEDQDVKETIQTFHNNRISDLDKFYSFLRDNEEAKQMLTTDAQTKLCAGSHVRNHLAHNLKDANPQEQENIHTLMLIYLFTKKLYGHKKEQVTTDEFLIIMNIACKLNGTGSTRISLYKYLQTKTEMEDKEIKFFAKHIDLLTKYDNKSLIYAAEAITYIVRNPESSQTGAAHTGYPCDSDAGTKAARPPDTVAAADAAGAAAAANEPREPEPQNNCSNIMAFFSCFSCCCGNKNQDNVGLGVGLLKSHPTSAQS